MRASLIEPIALVAELVVELVVELVGLIDRPWAQP